MAQYKILEGDCLELLKKLPDNSIDAVVTDPPYDLTANKKGGSGPASVNTSTPAGRARITTGFMGKKWDGTGIAFKVELWAEILRVLKPGGHLLAFGGTRTHHRMTCAIEDAGFEIRDELDWMYGSGFPKSLNLSKAIDLSLGVDREDKFEGSFTRHAGPSGNKRCDKCHKWLVSGSPCQCPRPQDEPITESAKRAKGYGTALKPGREPIVLARKPVEGTVIENFMKYGTGGLNIDACRLDIADTDDIFAKNPHTMGGIDGENTVFGTGKPTLYNVPDGRWPANVIFTHSIDCDDDGCVDDCPVAELNRQSGITTSGAMKHEVGGYGGESAVPFLRGRSGPSNQHGDTGGASRFFYVAKPSRAEREAGLDHLPECTTKETVNRKADSAGVQNPRSGAGRGAGTPVYECASCGLNLQGGRASTPCPNGDEHVKLLVGYGVGVKNIHPTVKPIELMRYLVRLITPKHGMVLDPFVGSGTTGCAAMLEGFNFIGMEFEPAHVPIAKGRIEYWKHHRELPKEKKPKVVKTASDEALF